MKNKPELSNEAKQAIFNYLRNWMIGAGIVNVAALVGIGFYCSTVLNSISDQAEASAVQAAEQRVSENSSIQQTIKRSLTSS